jgi:hypothetical protein
VGVRQALWADQRRSVWSPAREGAPDDETFPPELYAQLVAAVAANQRVCLTLGATPKRDLIHDVTPAGLYAETDASRAKVNPPQLIPAWTTGGLVSGRRADTGAQPPRQGPAARAGARRSARAGCGCLGWTRSVSDSP